MNRPDIGEMILPMGEFDGFITMQELTRSPGLQNHFLALGEHMPSRVADVLEDFEVHTGQRWDPARHGIEPLNELLAAQRAERPPQLSLSQHVLAEANHQSLATAAQRGSDPAGIVQEIGRKAQAVMHHVHGAERRAGGLLRGRGGCPGCCCVRAASRSKPDQASRRTEGG